MPLHAAVARAAQVARRQQAARRPVRRLHAASPFRGRGRSCYPSGMTDSRRRTAVLLTQPACSAAGPRADAHRARPRAVRQFLPARAHDALSRQRHRARVGARPSARAARRSTTSSSRRCSAPATSTARASCCSSPSRSGRGSPRRKALVRATVSLAGYAGLIRKVAFPHEIVVYASVGATFALQFAGYVVVLVALVAFGEPVHFEGLLLAVPLWIVLAIAVTGLALLLAGAAGLHPRRRARADAAPDDHDVPDADPLSADARARRRAAVGRRQSVRLARRRACATRCSTAVSRCSGATPSRSPSRSRSSSAGAGCSARLSPHFEDFL